MDDATKQILTEAIDEAFMLTVAKVYDNFLDAMVTKQDEPTARQRCADGLGFCRKARTMMLKMVEDLP
jgi:hypothetical protein